MQKFMLSWWCMRLYLYIYKCSLLLLRRRHRVYRTPLFAYTRTHARRRYKSCMAFAHAVYFAVVVMLNVWQIFRPPVAHMPLRLHTHTDTLELFCSRTFVVYYTILFTRAVHCEWHDDDDEMRWGSHISIAYIFVRVCI